MPLASRSWRINLPIHHQARSPLDIPQDCVRRAFSRRPRLRGRRLRAGAECVVVNRSFAEELGTDNLLGRRVRYEIFGRALLPVIAGTVVGGLLAVLIDSNVQTSLGHGWSIPGIVPACAIVMAAVALLAPIGPVRRGLRIQPVVALRDG